jgi:hypothetical protein
MRRFLFLLAGLALAVGGFAAIAALAADAPAGPSTTVPGSPGYNCSHGASNEPCRPDPSTNGKDCDDHGAARGNEDHCGPGTTETHTTTTETGHTTTTETGHTTTTETGHTTTTETGHTTTTETGHTTTTETDHTTTTQTGH